MNKRILTSVALLFLTASLCFAEEQSATESVQQGFWSQGLVGVCGGRISWWAWILSIVGFIITSVIVAWIAGGLLGAMDLSDKIQALASGGDGGGAGFGWFLPTGGLWFILSWGFPSGVVWWILWSVLLVLYLLIGGMIAMCFSEGSGAHVWGD